MTKIIDKYSGGATIYDDGVSLLSDKGGIKVERDGKLYVTHDGGSSWKQCCTGAGSVAHADTETIQRNIWFKHRNFEQDQLLVNGKSVYSTTVHSNVGDYIKGAICYSDGKGHVLVVDESSNSWHSSDHGETFTYKSFKGSQDFSFPSVGNYCIANNNDGKWIMTGQNDLFISEDDGVTWSLLSKNWRKNKTFSSYIDCNPASADGNNYDTWIAGSFRCSNDPKVEANWKDISKSYILPMFFGKNHDGKHVWFNSTYLASVSISLDNGQTWNALNVSAQIQKDFKSKKMMYRSDRNGRVVGIGSNNVMISDDYGVTWKFYTNGTGYESYLVGESMKIITDNKGFYYHLSGNVSSGQIMAYSTKNGLLFKSESDFLNIYPVRSNLEKTGSGTNYRHFFYGACWTGRRFIFLGGNGYISKSEMLTDEELALPFVPLPDIAPPNP